MRVHIVWQNEKTEPGEYLAWAQRRGFDVTYTKCWIYEEMPLEEEPADMLIVLGGWQNPGTTKEECDYYDSPSEQALIRKYVESGKIVIGSCLGAQLIGDALGGHFEKSPEPEIGPVLVSKTDEGRTDPFLKDLPDEFEAGEWHYDMAGLIPGSKVLARSEGCPRQIIRYGEFVYGLQCHMEFTHEIIVSFLEKIGDTLDDRENYRFIQSEEELFAYDYTRMNGLLSRFLDAVADAYLYA